MLRAIDWGAYLSDWQYSSRILPPPEDAEGTVFTHQYDWDVIQGTIEQFKALLGTGAVGLSDREMLMMLWNAHPELHPGENKHEG
jgi:hypothetical protein